MCRFESHRGVVRSKLRLSITISLDGYVAGADQSEDNPFGVGGMELHELAFPLKEFREMHGDQGRRDQRQLLGGSGALGKHIGATIMGRNMFGGGTRTWGDDPWPGWWGENPPYHHP